MEEDSPKQRMKDSHKCVENIEDIPKLKLSDSYITNCICKIDEPP